MNHKLRVLVSLDLDGGSARITVRGHVSTRSIQALYVVAKRANSIVAGLELLVDISEALVQPAALAMLQACSRSRRLPPAIDPAQGECTLTVLEPAGMADTRTPVTRTPATRTAGRTARTAGSRTALGMAA